MERTASGSSRALSRHSAPLRGSRVGRHPDRPRRVRSRASSQATQRRLPVVVAAPRGAEFDQRSQAGDEISRQPTPDPADDAVGAWPTSDNRGSVHQSGSGLSRQSKMPTRKRTLKRLLPVARGMNRSSCYSRL